MDEVKKRLESELNRTVERLRHMGGPLLSVDVMNRVGVNEDREMNFATRSLLVERANRLAEALERLRGGDYGTCEECGEPIAPARLRVMPEVRTCVRCQDRIERMSRHLAAVGAGVDGEEAEEE